MGQNMIKVLGKIPRRVCVAVSGGADSMAALDFIRNNGKRDVLALHFNHGTSHGKEAQAFVIAYCSENKIPLVTSSVLRDKHTTESHEEYWRNERYGFFGDYISAHRSNTSYYNVGHDELSHFYYSNTKIVTCHHLNDVVETWVFSSLHGNPMLIPYSRDNFIRPFLMTSKDSLVMWAEKKSVPYIYDPSNNDTKHMRNFVRKELIPKCLFVNPGIEKTIRKKIKSNFDRGMLSF
jgi:tRNA(Ile)-lysidine synthase